ncbi:MAG: tetratricopeptide repeat protein [Bacteroidales bacterium]|nr:tetratricopeptide repeat protein [Bacteroidales bacterium]
MKKIFVLFAAALMTAGVVSAQDLNQAIEAAKNGQMQFEMNNYPAAIEEFQNALTIAEGLGEEGAEHAETCKAAICQIYMAMAKEVYNGKKFQEAVEAFKKAKEVAEGYGNLDVAAEADELANNSQLLVYKSAGDAAKRAKDYATAIDNYTKMLELEPANGVAAYQLGDCYYRTKKFDEAVPYLMTAKDNGQEKNALPRLANIYVMKAKASLKAKSYDQALELANQAIGFEASSSAYETAGDATKALKNNAGAIELYEKALEGAKPKAVNQVKYKIATAAQEMGDKAKAIEYYTMIAGDPNFAEFANYQIKELSK